MPSTIEEVGSPVREDIQAAVAASNGPLPHEIPSHPAFDSIPDCIAAFARNEFIIVLDAPTRENEGDLIIAAHQLSPAQMSFMIRHTSGYICAPLPSTHAHRLHLPPMVPATAATDPNRTAYCVSLDAAHPDLTTGISAADRALTCRVLASAVVSASPEAAAPAETTFRRPGHILPLRARDGGVRARRGHTEAAVDLCRLAGLPPVAAIGELVVDGEPAPDGRPELIGGGMMRRDDCLAFGRRWGIRVCSIEDLVRYLEGTEGRWEGGVGGDY